jgi:MFS family permease
MSQFGLLKTRRFFPIFSTQFLGAFNDNIYKNSLVIFIAFTLADQADRNSSILVITAAGLFILPFFLFSAIAGQIADKFEKSMLIRRIKIAEIIIMAIATFGFIFLSLPVLMAVLFFMGTQSTMFGPLKYGILPQHLQETELTGGNGMIQMGTYLAILLGTILGGILIAIKPEGRILVSILVVFVAICGWLVSRKIPQAVPSDPRLKINWNFIAETFHILKLAGQNRTVFWAIIAISWFWFYGATFLSLLPSYTRDVLAGNEHITTLLLTAFSVGIGAGSLMCEKLSGKRIEMGLMPLGAIGLSVFAFDLFIVGVPEFATHNNGEITVIRFIELQGWRVFLDLCLIGAFGGIYIVPLYALVQSLSEATQRSRIIAANNILNALFMVISALLTIGLFAMSFSIPQMFLLVSILNIFVISFVIFQVPDFKHRFFVLLGKLKPV